MKKKIKYLVLAFIFSLSSLSISATEINTVESTDPEERIEQIENRVQEIWKIDFTEIDKVEKVALKEELKNMKKELKTTGLDSKVSISLGAAIIILLLLIIIL